MNQQKLKSILEYDPYTGLFFWKYLRRHRPEESMTKPAGSVNSKYRYCTIEIDGKRYQSSHLAWLYMTGEYPEYCVYSKNKNVTDLRWDNLYLNYNRPMKNNRNFKKQLTGINALNLIGSVA